MFGLGWWRIDQRLIGSDWVPKGDTRSQPMPEMRHVDASAKPGGRYIYAVMTVNSVGLKSEPAAAAANGEQDKKSL